jgi:Sigma-70 region 2
MTGDPPPTGPAGPAGPTDPARRFSDVFDAYFAEIHRYAAKRLGPDAAADVAAQAFLEAFRERRRYDAERASVRTWLYGIATKVIGRHQRAELRALRALARLSPDRDASEHADQVDSRVSAEGLRGELMVSGQSYILRPATGAYAITGAATENFSWWGRKTGMGESFWDRNLPAGPVTASDVSAWRAAGSPSSFRVWSGDHYATYTSATTPWQLDHPNANGGGKFAGGKTAADLQQPPADSVKLAKLYYSPAALAKAGLPKGASVGAKVALTAGMLGGAPLPPKVQAGFIRALSAQPGVHAIGDLTDPLGRRGVALASDEHAVTVTSQFGAPPAEQGTYRSRQVLIFDPSNGALLAQEEQLTKPGGAYAQEKPGFVIDYLAVRSAGWTNARLTPPAPLPPR